MICDICGYMHLTLVTKDPDGILRCAMCRHRTKYKRFNRGPTEKGGEFTNYWKSILYQYYTKKRST